MAERGHDGNVFGTIKGGSDRVDNIPVDWAPLGQWPETMGMARPVVRNNGYSKTSGPKQWVIRGSLVSTFINAGNVKAHILLVGIYCYLCNYCRAY